MPRPRLPCQGEPPKPTKSGSKRKQQCGRGSSRSRRRSCLDEGKYVCRPKGAPRGARKPGTAKPKEPKQPKVGEASAAREAAGASDEQLEAAIRALRIDIGMHQTRAKDPLLSAESRKAAASSARALEKDVKRFEAVLKERKTDPEDAAAGPVGPYQQMYTKYAPLLRGKEFWVTGAGKDADAAYLADYLRAINEWGRIYKQPEHKETLNTVEFRGFALYMRRNFGYAKAAMKARGIVSDLQYAGPAVQGLLA